MKTRLLCFLALATLLSFSCQKQERIDANANQTANQSEVRQAIKSLTITLEDNDSKLQFQDASTTKVEWSIGDQISVNGILSDALTTGGKTVKFTFPGEGVTPDAEGKLSVVYPGNADNLEYTGDVYSFKISRALSSKGSNFLDKAIMAGKGIVENETLKIQLHHAMSYLKIQPNGGEAFRRIYIHGYSTMISGYYNIHFGEDNVALSTKRDNFSYAAMDCASMELAEGDSYIIAVPAGEYSNGLYIKLLGANKKASIKTLKTEGEKFVATAGKILSLETTIGAGFDFNPTQEPNEISNQTEYDMLEYAFANSNKEWRDDWAGVKGEDNNVIYLNANITATKPLTTSGDFAYTLEGNTDKTFTYPNYTDPYLLKVSARGKVCNLNMVSSTSTFTKNSATLAQANRGIISNVTNTITMDITATNHFYCSGLVISNGGLIEDCTINGEMNITFNPTAASLATIGGISCSAAETANFADVKEATLVGDFTNCINNADITLTNVNTSAAVLYRTSPIAGICASVIKGTGTQYPTFDGCINNGAITLKESKALVNGAFTIGGIVGRAAQYNTSSGNNMCLQVNTGDANEIYLRLLNCTNTGKIDQAAMPTGAFTLDGTGARIAYAGGIIGAAFGRSTNPIELNNCSNTGSICGGYAGKAGVVLGGLVGISSYVDIVNSSSLTVIGDSSNATTNKQVAAIGGLIGFVKRVTNVSNSKAYLKVNASNTALVSFDAYTPNYVYGLGCAALSARVADATVASATFTNCQFGAELVALAGGLTEIGEVLCSHPNSAVTSTAVTFDLQESDLEN